MQQPRLHSPSASGLGRIRSVWNGSAGVLSHVARQEIAAEVNAMLKEESRPMTCRCHHCDGGVECPESPDYRYCENTMETNETL